MSKTYRFSMLAAVLAILTGSLELTGHIAGIHSLTDLLPGTVRMMPASAVGFVFAGLSLAFSTRATSSSESDKGKRYIAVLLAGLPVFMALFSLYDYAIGSQFGVDESMVRYARENATIRWLSDISVKSAVCFTLLSTSLLLNMFTAGSNRAVIGSVFCSTMIVTLSATSMFTYYSPAIDVLGWHGLHVMSGESALLFLALGTSTLLVACKQKAFEWVLGRLTTAGFITGMALLIFIGLTATRAQQDVSEANLRIARSEMSFAKSASLFSAASRLQNNVLNFLLTDDLGFLNNSLVASDRIRILLDELNQGRINKPDTNWLYAPLEQRTLDMLAWATRALNTRDTKRPPEEWRKDVRNGNILLARMGLTMDQLESEHRQHILELKLQSERVRKTSFLTIALGTLASLCLFFGVMLRVNHLVIERQRARNELLESEHRFRTLFEGISSVAVQGYAPDLTTTYWNTASQTLYGYSAEEAIGRKLTELIIPPEMADEVRSGVAQMVASGVHIPTQELSLQRKDGTRVDVISSHAIVQTSGKSTELFCVDIDISQRKQIELELENYRSHLEDLVHSRTLELATAKDAAESASRAKSAFLSNMSHEIRTPMNAIIGFTHLLRRESSDDKTRAKLDKISAAAQHLLGILNDILDLSKIEAKRLTLEEKEFSPAEFIDTSLAMLKERAQSKGLRLTRVIDPALPSRLLGDSLRLSQIVLNLVGNAIKFADHGEISVRLLLTGEDAESVILRLEVRDEGIGLSEEQQARIFHPFVQADDSTTRKYGGTGLGLAICRHIVQAMDGSIGVDSQLGHGSLFWATARVHKSKNPAADISEISQSLAQKTALEDRLRAQYAGQRILLVEDDLICREVALELLDLTGLAIDTAANGQEAVDHVRAGNYALVLMDVQMPRMNGIEAARIIRKLPGREKLPSILAMTANAFEEDRQSCLDAGMDDHIGKPLDPDDLYQKLLHWLGKCASPATLSTTAHTAQR